MKILEMLATEEFFFSAIQLTVPILFAALAAIVSNKAGIININIEGSMSISALIGAIVSYYAKSWFIGILAGVIVGVIMGILLAFFAHKLKTDSILAGVALNILTSGLVVFLLFTILGNKGDTTNAPSVLIPNIVIPFLSNIPYIGVFFSQSFLYYVAIVSVFVVIFIFNKTKLGLQIKAVGYNPEAAKSVGISVAKTQLKALIIAGIFAGLGGVFLSMSFMSTFNNGMVAGRGFIGIAAEAMGGGNPILTMLFSLIFGIVSAFSIEAQIISNVPYQILNTFPYIMTIIALILHKLRKNKNKNVKEGNNDEKSMEKRIRTVSKL